MCFTTSLYSWFISLSSSLYSWFISLYPSLYSWFITMAGQLLPVVPQAPDSYMALPWSFSPKTESFTGEVKEYHDVLEGLVLAASPSGDPGTSCSYSELVMAAATSSYASATTAAHGACVGVGAQVTAASAVAVTDSPLPSTSPLTHQCNRSNKCPISAPCWAGCIEAAGSAHRVRSHSITSGYICQP